MEQLTAYRVKHKLNGLVFLFKYDLNGDLKVFEICESALNEKQNEWLYTPRFPSTERKIKLWQTTPAYTDLFEIEVSPADTSFEALWVLFDNKVAKLEAQKSFSKLKPNDVIKCFVEVPFYLQYLKQNPGIGKLHLATYINKRRFDDERPQITMKVGKVFNPMIADLAKMKTDRKIK